MDLDEFKSPVIIKDKMNLKGHRCDFILVWDHSCNKTQSKGRKCDKKEFGLKPRTYGNDRDQFCTLLQKVVWEKNSI